MEDADEGQGIQFNKISFFLLSQNSTALGISSANSSPQANNVRWFPNEVHRNEETPLCLHPLAKFGQDHSKTIQHPMVHFQMKLFLFPAALHNQSSRYYKHLDSSYKTFLCC